MEIKLNIAKKHLYILMAFVLAVAGIALVIGYGTTTPDTFGHSAGELMVTVGGVATTLQSAIDDGSLGGDTDLVWYPINGDEDEYSGYQFVATSGRSSQFIPYDTCDGRETSFAGCLPAESRECDDYFYTDGFSYYDEANNKIDFEAGWYYLQVICKKFEVPGRLNTP